MVDIAMAKIETTKPKQKSQPVESHVQGIPAACPTNGLKPDTTKKPMTITTMMTFAKPNDNDNVSTTMTTPNAANAHVTQRAHRSWEGKGAKPVPA